MLGFMNYKGCILSMKHKFCKGRDLICSIYQFNLSVWAIFGTEQFLRHFYGKKMNKLIYYFQAWFLLPFFYH